MRASRTSWAVGLCVVALLVVGLRFYWTPERAQRNAAVDRRALALEVLGRHLAAHCPGDRVLLIGNPFVQRPGQPAEIKTFEAAALRGLRRGLGDRLELAGVDYPALTSQAAADPASVRLPPNATTPLSFMTARGAWDDLRRRHPDANVWVSLIGLPAGLTRMAVWREREPRFALLLPDLQVLGRRSAVPAALRSGKLVAVVLRKPGAAPPGVSSAGDPQAEFDRRFLLLTPENHEAVFRQYPGLF